MIFHCSESRIRNGTPGQGDRCPVATAVKARLPRYRVFVHPTTILIDGKEYALPTKVQEFIEKYDRFGPYPSLLAFKFEIPGLEVIDGEIRSELSRFKTPGRSFT